MEETVPSATASVKDTHKFVVMDFEFTMINKTSIVLISGAMSNTLDRYKLRKLEGRPLLLPINEEVRSMKDIELNEAKKEIQKIFSCKKELRDACLDKLDKILNSQINSLNTVYIENYILKGDMINVLVVWNGHSNNNVLKRLGITRFPILNITCCDKLFNQTFFIQLGKLQSKQIIFEIEIGTFDKKERFLNLEQTHKLVCQTNHRATYANDSCKNVKFIKCIFDYAIRKYRYENLIKNFS